MISRKRKHASDCQILKDQSVFHIGGRAFRVKIAKPWRYTSCIVHFHKHSSPTSADCIKPKTFEIGSDCSFAKTMAFRSENYGSFEYDLKNGGPLSQYVWHVTEPSMLKAVSDKHRSKFAALSPVMVTVAI
jgi:hypothetical protein